MSIPAHERLLDLIIALAQSRAPMTRAQIRSQVNGYTEDDGDPRTAAAFERMFERDKETLKELGIPLVTVHGTGHYDDIRYQIDLEEYTLPDVQFSAAELGVLAVASHVWDGSVLSRQARRGLTKLQGATLVPAETDFSPAVRLHEPDAALPDLIEAISAKKVAAFTYAAASTGEETRRQVEPWQLTVKNQGWYLRGWDRDRQAGREFRLSRITSRVKLQDHPFTGPAPQVVSEETDAETARLAILPGAAALLRARGEYVGSHGERDLIELPVADLTSFAGEVASYGPAVVAAHPPRLRELVLRKLRALAELAQEER